MTKVAKKFHLDSDGYLTTKPDRQLTTEEEAAEAAKAAIDEALEEGGAIAEAIAAGGGGGDEKTIVKLYVSEDLSINSLNQKKTFTVSSSDYVIKDVYDAILAGKPVECQVIYKRDGDILINEIIILDVAYCSPNAESSVQQGAPCFNNLIFSRAMGVGDNDVLFRAFYMYYNNSFEVSMSLIDNKADA